MPEGALLGTREEVVGVSRMKMDVPHCLNKKKREKTTIRLYWQHSYGCVVVCHTCFLVQT